MYVIEIFVLGIRKPYEHHLLYPLLLVLLLYNLSNCPFGYIILMFIGYWNCLCNNFQYYNMLRAGKICEDKYVYDMRINWTTCEIDVST